MNTTLTFIIIAVFIIAINLLYIAWQLKNKEPTYYKAVSGELKGQTHDIKDWRKIAVELTRTVKSSRLNTMAKYGTDEDIIGLLYINFGIELIDI